MTSVTKMKATHHAISATEKKFDWNKLKNKNKVIIDMSIKHSFHRSVEHQRIIVESFGKVAVTVKSKYVHYAAIFSWRALRTIGFWAIKSEEMAMISPDSLLSDNYEKISSELVY